MYFNKNAKSKISSVLLPVLFTLIVLWHVSIHYIVENRIHEFHVISVKRVRDSVMLYTYTPIQDRLTTCQLNYEWRSIVGEGKESHWSVAGHFYKERVTWLFRENIEERYTCIIGTNDSETYPIPSLRASCSVIRSFYPSGFNFPTSPPSIAKIEWHAWVQALRCSVAVLLSHIFRKYIAIILEYFSIWK